MTYPTDLDGQIRNSSALQACIASPVIPPSFAAYQPDKEPHRTQKTLPRRDLNAATAADNARYQAHPTPDLQGHVRVPPLVLLAAVWGYAGLLGGLVVQRLVLAGWFNPSPFLNDLLAFATVGAAIYGPIITLLLVCWNLIHRTRLIESAVATAMIIPLVLAAIGVFRHALAT